MEATCNICNAAQRSKFCPSCNKYMCQKCCERHGRMAANKSHILEDMKVLQDSEAVICEICLEYSSDVYCNDCKQYICLECKSMHDISDDNKSHILIQSKDKVIVCAIHDAQVLKFFCESCSNLICELCVTTKHNNHQIRTGSKPSAMISAQSQTATENQIEFGKSEKGDSLPGAITANKIPLQEFRNLSIKRWSMGRHAKLGQLYNINTDEVLRETLFVDEPPAEDVEINRLNNKSETKKFDPLSLQECFNVFGLSSHEKRNILLDYCKPEGHAAFLTEEQLRSYHSKAVGFAIRKETKEEILLYAPKASLFDNMQKRSLLESLPATHYIAGVEYGIISVLIGEDNGKENGGGFDSSVSKLMYNIGQGKQLDCTEFKSFVRQYNTTILKDTDTRKAGNFEVTNKNLVTIQDIDAILDNNIDRNDWPIRCTLLPLDIQANTEYPVASYGQANTKTTTAAGGADVNEAIISYFEEIINVYHQMNEKRKVIEENKLCLSSRQLNCFNGLVEQLKRSENEVKHKIAEILHGNEPANPSHSIFSTEKLTNVSAIRDRFKSQASEIMKKIEVFREIQKHNVIFISEGNSVSEIRRNFNIKRYCAFFYHMNEPGFEVCKYEFIRLAKAAMESLQNLNENEISAHAITNTDLCFIAVDLEVTSDQATAERIPQGNHICTFDHGSYRSCESSEDIEKEKRENFTRYDPDLIVKLDKKPMKRIMLKLQCPCNSDSAARQSMSWRCQICRNWVQCNFHKTHFFCDCGQAPIESYSFRCGSATHGENFKFFYPSLLAIKLRPLKVVESINILLLGETGVGKSTWINGIINYLTHETLKDAVEAEELITLVKSSFILTDESFVEKKIVVGTQYGKNDNEADVTKGASATQRPMIYYFSCGEINVRLIDTPGVGDTRGHEKDKENFDAILKCLRKLDNLHGICILLKPNTSRLNVVFRYCISELLTHLHRDAADNIVFCFTNARSTFYRPGDTLVPLQTMLESYRKNQDVNIEISKKTMYCLDNESFRFLCALKHEVKFTEDERKTFDKSWDVSRKETQRFFDYISKLKPHELVGTLSLNDSREIILGLSEPIAEISKNIATNIEVVKQKKTMIQGIAENDSQLKKKLNMNVVEIEPEALEFPMTVCTSPHCTETIAVGVGFVTQTLYKTECHKECYLKGVQPEVISTPALKVCRAMDKTTGKCTQCGCVWDSHMHRTYRINKKCKTMLNPIIQELIDKGASNKTLLEEAVRNAQSLINEMESSQKLLTERIAQFGSFLKKNAITPYNDAFDEYISFQIKEERARVTCNGSDFNLKTLLNLQASYKEQVRLLEGAMSDKHSHLTPADISRIRDDLYAMKNVGDQMKSIVEVVERAKHSMYNASVVTYTRPVTSKSKGILYDILYGMF